VVEENKKKKEFVPTKKRYKIFVFSLKKKENKYFFYEIQQF
jgi:hypothetical protein